jgi:hypothetical protein
MAAEIGGGARRRMAAPPAAAGVTGGGPSLPRPRSGRRRQTPARGGLDRIERQGHLDAVSAGP